MISLLIKVDLIFLLNQFFDIIGFIVIKFIVLFVIKSTWGFINFIVLLFACASVCGRNTPPCQIVKGDDLSPVRHKTVVHTGNVVTDENSAKEKETDNSVSNSEGCAYTPEMVEIAWLEHVTCTLRTYRSTRWAISPKLWFDYTIFPEKIKRFFASSKKFSLKKRKLKVNMKIFIDSVKIIWQYCSECIKIILFGGIAQLVRAHASHAWGHRFEPCCPHQIL